MIDGMASDDNGAPNTLEAPLPYVCWPGVMSDCLSVVKKYVFAASVPRLASGAVIWLGMAQTLVGSYVGQRFL